MCKYSFLISRIYSYLLQKYNICSDNQLLMKGWYIAARPGTEGDTTVWYTSFWYFIAKYAAVRLGERWCLTADQ